MARKRYKPEEIVAKLRQVDVLVSQGQAMADAIRQIGVSEVRYYRWRQEFGGLKSEQVKRLKDLQLENSRLTTIAQGALYDATWLCYAAWSFATASPPLAAACSASPELPATTQ
jgi:putative transposase